MRKIVISHIALEEIYCKQEVNREKFSLECLGTMNGILIKPISPFKICNFLAQNKLIC